MTLFYGPTENTYNLGPMKNLLLLRAFDKKTFGAQANTSALNLVVLDYNENPECVGKYGLPDKASPALFYIIHSEIAPYPIGDPQNPATIEGAHHLGLLQHICRADMDMKMLWNKCSFFLVDYAKENAIVLITEKREEDPAKNWLGSLVINAYELNRGSHAYLVPIIGPLYDD